MIKRNYPARCENNLLGVWLLDEEKPCALLMSDAERWWPREVQPGWREAAGLRALWPFRCLSPRTLLPAAENLLFLSEKQEFVTLWMHLKLVLMVRWVEKVAKPRAKSPWETGDKPGKVRKMGILLMEKNQTNQTSAGEKRR